MRKLNPKYVQLVADAVIPLAGILFWDWGLYFILLFYFLDMIASEVITHLKSKKTIEFSGIGQKLRTSYGFQSAIFLSITLLAVHAAMYFIDPAINFKTEIFAFWTYEELGIQQGYVLTPLVAFGAYQQYKMSFFMIGQFQKVTQNEIWNPHIKAYLVIIGAAGIAIGLAQVVDIPEMVYVLLIVVASTTYQLLFNK